MTEQTERRLSAILMSDVVSGVREAHEQHCLIDPLQGE